MKPEELQSTLERLRTELAQTTEVEGSTREALQGLIAEIERIVSDPGGQQQPAEAAGHSLIQRLQEKIEEFEIRHPQLTAILSQLLDRLAEIGI